MSFCAAIALTAESANSSAWYRRVLLLSSNNACFRLLRCLFSLEGYGKLTSQTSHTNCLPKRLHSAMLRFPPILMRNCSEIWQALGVLLSRNSANRNYKVPPTRSLDRHRLGRSHGSLLPLTLCGEGWEKVDCYKYICLLLTSDLAWRSHIHKI